MGASGGPTGGRSEHHAGPPVPGVGDGGRVCPGKCPLGASVRSVFKQIAGSQKLLQWPTALLKAKSQLLGLLLGYTRNSQLVGVGDGREEGVCLPRSCGGEAFPEDPGGPLVAS